MKKSKRLFILLGVLLAACGATFAISRHEEEKEKIQNSDEIILAIEADSVTSLSWEFGENAFAFHKDEKWLYDEDEAFPVDEEKLVDLLEQFQEFGVSFVIEEVEDIAQYGLDEPECTIHITAGEQEYTVTLGAFSTMDSQRYLSIGDGKVYLASHDPFEEYELEIRDLIKHDEIPEISAATGIQFSGMQEYEISYEEESTNTYCEEDVYFVDSKPLDTSLVEDYLDTVAGLGLSEYVSYNVTEEELEAFGLAEPELTITSESFVLHLGRNQEELAAALESEEEDAEENVTAYARVGESQIVYEITSSEYADLTKNTYDDLRHKEVLTAAFEDIYQMDITLEGVEHTFSIVVEEDVKSWKYGEEDLSVSGIQSAMTALTAESFTSEEPTEKEEISFTVYMENENYPEIHVELYRYDGSKCIAVVDGETFAMVSRSSVVDLMEAVYGIVLGSK